MFLLSNTIRGEKKYGIHTFEPSELHTYTIKKGDISKASPYEAVNYYILEKLLENFRKLFPAEKCLLDAGCGKGRVLAVAAHYGFEKITGVDFAEELCEEARRQILKVNEAFPQVEFKIVWDDMVNYPVTKENVFFLFNPFEKEILERVLFNIECSVKQFPRTIYFIYASPQHLEVLKQKGFNVVYKVRKMQTLEGVIAVRQY